MFSNTGVNGFPRVLHQVSPSQKDLALSIFMEKGLPSLLTQQKIVEGKSWDFKRTTLPLLPLSPHPTYKGIREKGQPLRTETYCVPCSVPSTHYLPLLLFSLYLMECCSLLFIKKKTEAQEDLEKSRSKAPR